MIDHAHGAYARRALEVPALRCSDARRLVAEASALLLDWDGCVAMGNRLVPSAVRLIAANPDRVAIVSNNSTHLPADMAALLKRHGIVLPESRIVMAGTETVQWALGQKCANVLMYASARLRGHALEHGLELVRDAAMADTVILMRDVRFSYGRLQRATQALQNGAQLVVSNADRVHPGAGGILMPETGALLAAIRACVPDADPIIIGKPGPSLFRRACTALGVDPQNAVMIGDNPDTDIQGAMGLGIAPILVGPASPVQMDDLVE
ncbi:MAG: HAD family hydrolase [Sphingomonadaceae bacterium]